MPPIPGTRPQHARHTRAQPNTGRPNNSLNPPLQPVRRRRYRIRYRLRPQWRLGRLAIMLWPVSPIHNHIMQGIDRTDYAGLRMLNSVLGNPPWPMWNAFQEPTSVAYPLPVHEIPVVCDDYIPLLRVPAPSNRIPFQYYPGRNANFQGTYIDWLEPEGPRLKCFHTEQHIRTHGVQFYRCTMKTRPEFHNRDTGVVAQPNRLRDLRRTYAHRLANPGVRYAMMFTEPPGYHWVCSECARLSEIHYDLTLWNRDRIWLYCSVCSDHHLHHYNPMPICDCRQRFSVAGIPGPYVAGVPGPNLRNTLCSHCRSIVALSAQDIMMINVTQRMHRGQERIGTHVPQGSNPISDDLIWDRNNCRRQCRGKYPTILGTYIRTDPTTGQTVDRGRAKYRECTICCGYIREENGRIPINLQIHCL